ncbi:MAG: hypothetical protein K2P81_06760 [Bacteriovoracaceae bacterium]|nr:hypothetical protein [Bacteriovoracaceae bacterium]
MKFIFALFLISSCANKAINYEKTIKQNDGQVYGYRDVSGDFEFAREVKLKNNKIATRVRILSPGSEGERLLEKTFAMSSVGSVKTKKGRELAIRPIISQHTVWLEGKKYFTQMKTNTKRKSFEVLLDSPDERWKGSKEVKFPKGKIFCFYSQLPECLLTGGLIKSAKDKNNRVAFVLIWDSWPYHQEHFSGLGASPFSSAFVRIEKSDVSKQAYNVEVSGQTINLHFSKDFAFVRMFWTAQGISILPPAELQDTQEL